MASKILAVFGATGNQGGSVLRAILADPVLSKEYKLRGVTRDASKPAAQALAAKGVEMVSADMSSVESAAPAVKDAHTVFLITDFWASMSDEVEKAQGMAVTDASKAAGVKHMIFSSLLDTTEATQGRLPHITHFVGKAAIEKYINASGIPATYVRPGMFMSGIVKMFRPGEDGSYSMNLPMDPAKAKIPLFDPAADIGAFVAAAVREYPNYTGKYIDAAENYYTPNQIIADFTEATGKKATYNKIPGDVFKSFLSPAVAQELLENMLLTEDVGYYGGADLEPSKKLIGDYHLTTWKEYVKANFKA